MRAITGMSNRFLEIDLTSGEIGTFEVDERDAYSFYMGCVQLVMRQRNGYVGVADPRRDGSAGGPVA